MQIEPTQFAERLVSSMPDAIVCADAEGVIRLWNRGAVRIFGFAQEEAVGCSLDIIIPERLQRVGRNRRTPLPTSWRARKGLPSWICEAEKSPHQDARS